MSESREPSKAMKLDEYSKKADFLMDELDKYRYDHGVEGPAGVKVANALNWLKKVAVELKEAAGEQALTEVRQSRVSGRKQ